MTIPHINNVLTMAHMIYMACGTFFLVRCDVRNLEVAETYPSHSRVVGSSNTTWCPELVQLVCNDPMNYGSSSIKPSYGHHIL